MTKQWSADTNTVYFTVKDELARNILKDIWSIVILNNVHRIAPAYFDAADFNKRKAFQGEFTSFMDEDNAAKALEVLHNYDPITLLNLDQTKS